MADNGYSDNNSIFERYRSYRQEINDEKARRQAEYESMTAAEKKAYRKALSSDVSVVGVPCRVEADGYFALVKRVLAEEVADDDVIMSDGTYAYISVLDPVGKDDVVLTDTERYAEMVQMAIA